MFSLRLGLLPRRVRTLYFRTHHSYLNLPLPTIRLVPSPHHYSSSPPGWVYQQDSHTPSTATGTSPPPPPSQHSASNNKTAPHPVPPSQQSSASKKSQAKQQENDIWTDESSAIPRSPPKPTAPEIAGQVESLQIHCRDGIEIEGHNKQVVGAVLDMMQGKVTTAKMNFWEEDDSNAGVPVLENNINKAVGRQQVEALLWGKARAMSNISMQHHEVVRNSENEIEMEVVNQYTVKGVGTVHTIKSRVTIEINPETGKIRRVIDRWGGELPTGKFAELFRKAGGYATSKIVNVPKDS